MPLILILLLVVHPPSARTLHIQEDTWTEISGKPDPRCSLGSSYDYVLLVLQWPPGQWRVHPSKVQPDFGIHGLWPGNDGRVPNYPCECSDEVFRSSDLSAGLIAKLNEHFPTNFRGGNYGFWAHEWRKHGTCSKRLPGCGTISGYFQSVLDMREKLSVLSALSKAGIVPSDDIPYTAGQIMQAVKSQIGVSPLLGCSHFKGKKALMQVSFCYNTKLQLIECNNNVKNQRGGGVTNCDDYANNQIYMPSSAWANQKSNNYFRGAPY